MKRAIVTGAAGFTGAVLTEELRKEDVEVYAVVRPGSDHNKRLNRSDDGLHVVELNACDYGKVHEITDDECDVCFHLTWDGGREINEQRKNIGYALDLLESVSRCGCKRFIATGSQAEYGVISPDVIQTESLLPEPITAYGASKVASCHMSRVRAKEQGIDWIWGRIFSLIGKYEPRGRMLPDLYHSLKEGKPVELSSCNQNWDYLDVHDAAEALIALAKKGKEGEIYNIACGAYKPLRDYTEELRSIVAPEMDLLYGDDPNPFISLQPSIDKIIKDTGWKPKKSFKESIKDYDCKS